MISLQETLETLFHTDSVNEYGFPVAPMTWRLPTPPPVVERKPKLFFTLGAQRSGKSTIGRQWHHRQASLTGEVDDGYPRFMWDTDALRLEIHGDAYHKETEPMVFAIKHYAIATALRIGTDVVVCGTHSTRSSIRRILEIRRDAIPVLIDTPLEVCLQRARDTDQDYLLPVIPKVHARIETIKALGVNNYLREILFDMDYNVQY